MALRKLGHSVRARTRSFLGLPPAGNPEGQPDRWVFANSPTENVGFASNEVVTSKYTWYNFLPVFLFEQFTRFANAYFLLVSIIQTIPSVSITGGVPTNFVPLSIVLAFDGIVTAREDYKRHQDDAKANSSAASALRDEGFTTVPWKQVRVGDILKIRRGETVPADCIFLASYTTDTNTPDTCYVQTAQLDGETNLKLRKACARTAAYFTSDEACAEFNGAVRCEGPNASFEHFVGMLWMQRSSPDVPRKQARPGEADAPDAVAAPAVTEAAAPEGPISLEAEQLLLRGSVVRNVDYVYAFVMYTGRETKVRVKQTSRVLKRARVEKEINRLGLILMFILIAFCVTGMVGAVIWTAERNYNIHAGARLPGKQPPPAYLLARRVTFLEGLQRVCTYFLLNAGFIPISLYTTVRLARTLQMTFMEKDVQMVHEEAAGGSANMLAPPPAPAPAAGDAEGEGAAPPAPAPPAPPTMLSFPCKVRTMDLADELGQITHVFSDKTGTLTQNYMAFRKMSVAGVAYGVGSTRMGVSEAERAAAAAAAAAASGGPSPFPSLPHVDYQDGSTSHPGRTLAADATDPRDGGQGTAIALMLVHLALNHTVLPETVRDPNNPSIVLGTRLSASSPDEEAFLYAAETFGYKFVSRMHDVVTLRCRHPWSCTPFAAPGDDAEAAPSTPNAATAGGCELPFRVLHILSYSQERKRMSVIIEAPVWDAATRRPVQGGGKGALYLFCKGADSVILPRLCAAPADSLDTEMRRATRRYLADWGSDGLRTLVFAYKSLTRADFEAWSADFVRACTDIEQVRRRKAKQPNAIEELMNEIETGLTLQGATANEDQLQSGVPETIAQLGRAGIKIWMVTGDKQETATTIGFACKLLDDTMRQIVATVDSAGDVRAAVKRIRVAAKRMRLEKEEDSQAAASNRTQMENLMDWFSRGLEVIESRMGFAPAGGGKDAAAIIPFPAAAGPPLQPPTTPRHGGKSGGSMPTPPTASLLGEAIGSSPPPRASGAVGDSPAHPLALPPPASTDTNSSGSSSGTSNPASTGKASSTSASPAATGSASTVAGSPAAPGASPPEGVVPAGSAEQPRRGRAGTLLRMLLSGSSGSGEEGTTEETAGATSAAGALKPATPTATTSGSAVGRLMSRASRALSFSHSDKADAVDAAAAAASGSEEGRFRGASFESEDGELIDAATLFEEEAAAAAAAGKAEEEDDDAGGAASSPASETRGHQSDTTGSAAPPSLRVGAADVESDFTGVADTEREAEDEGDDVAGCGAGGVGSSYAASTAHVPTASTPAVPPARPVVASSSGEASDEAVIAKLTAPLVGARRRPFALIIDEQVLDAALEHPKTRAYLLYVAVNCTSVICCRARPDQKAQVVRLIKDGIKHSCTLAIGDGANDVAMIRQAAVGVGIAGVEGVQAANASDYAIGRFRFLQRLLLVHGRWNYSRMSRLVLYIFYKNVLFVCTQYWYSVDNGFSGQKFFIEYGSQLYNLLFTALPVLMMAVLDVDLPAETVLAYPALYEHGRRGRGLNVRVFLSWVMAAIAESLAIYFVAAETLPVPDGDYGATPYVFSLGLVCFTVVLAVVSLRIMLEMHSHWWYFQFFTAGCALIWLPFCFLDDLLNGDGMRGMVRHVFDSAAVWFTMTLLITCCVLRAAAWRAWRRFYRPSFEDVVREAHALTGSFATIDVYAAALDLARRTGKTVQEVLDAASITQAAAAAVAARRAAAAAAKGSAEAVGATLLRPLSWIGAGVGRAFTFQTAAGSPRPRSVPGPASVAKPDVTAPVLLAAPEEACKVPPQAGAVTGTLAVVPPPISATPPSLPPSSSTGHLTTDPTTALPPLLREALYLHPVPLGYPGPAPPSGRTEPDVVSVPSPLEAEGLRSASPVDASSACPAPVPVPPPRSSPTATSTSPDASSAEIAATPRQQSQRKRWWRRASTGGGASGVTTSHKGGSSFFALETPSSALYPPQQPEAFVTGAGKQSRGRQMQPSPQPSPPASVVTIKAWGVGAGDEAAGTMALPGSAGLATTPVGAGAGPLLPLTAPAPPVGPSPAPTPRWHRGASLADLTPVMLEGSSVLERTLLPGRRRFDSEAMIPTLAYDETADFDHELPAEQRDTWAPEPRVPVSRRLRNRGSRSALAEELDEAEASGEGSHDTPSDGAGPFGVVTIQPATPAPATDSSQSRVPRTSLGVFIGEAGSSGGGEVPLLPAGVGSGLASSRSSLQGLPAPSPSGSARYDLGGWRSASVEPPASLQAQPFVAASSGPATAGGGRGVFTCGVRGHEAHHPGPLSPHPAALRRARSAGAAGSTGTGRHRRPHTTFDGELRGSTAVSQVGADFTVDPAVAEYIAARFTTYGPQTHALSRWFTDAPPPQPVQAGPGDAPRIGAGSGTFTVPGLVAHTLHLQPQRPLEVPPATAPPPPPAAPQLQPPEQ